MPRHPANRAARAAEQLTHWLQEYAGEPRQSAGGAWPPDPVPHTERKPVRLPQAGPAPTGPPHPTPAHGQRIAPAHTDWLYHHLTVTGSAEQLDAFRGAAAGAGVVPWRLDLDRMEEDFFLRLVVPPSGQKRTLSLEGARMLATELREAVGRRHALAVARVGSSRACPFDLYALVPVPAGVLLLGPDHPDAIDWLWTHWGTTDALRSVVSRQPPVIRSDKAGEGQEFALSFWAADWTPWRALDKIRAKWSELRFAIRPIYEL